MLTAILVSCILLIVKEVIQCIGEHLICSDNPYEMVVCVAWVGWYVTVAIFAVKLIEAVNTYNPVTLTWQ